MTLEIGQNAAQAGHYAFLGEQFFVDDVIDPALVREIRTFDPDYVPLLVKRRYRSPAGGEVEAMYHVIGRQILNPSEGYEDAAVTLAFVPSGFAYDPGKIHPLRTLWAPWHGPNWDGQGAKPDPEWTRGEPPAYIKPERWLVEQMRATRKALDIGMALETGEDGELHQTTRGHRDFTADKLREILEFEEKRDEKIMAEASKEARYRARHNWRWLKRAADEERFVPEPPGDRPKPFVDLGGRS